MRGLHERGIANVAIGTAAAPGVVEADLAGCQVERCDSRIQENEPRADVNGLAHGSLGAGLSAQEDRQLVGGRSRQDRRLELQDLPAAIGILDGGGIGAGKKGGPGDGGKRDVGAAGSGSSVTPTTAGAAATACSVKFEFLRRAIDGDGAGPGDLGRRHVAGIGLLVAAQQWKIEKQHERLVDDDRGTAAPCRANDGN